MGKISMASKASTILCIFMAALVMPSSLKPRDGCFLSSFIPPLFREDTFVFPQEAMPTKSGYLTVNASSKARMFYAFYDAIEPPTPIAQTPIILWLQGGPGCSSMIGNFYEFGPWRISSDERLCKNQWPWNHKYGVLFIDNPVGSGYSIAEKHEDIPVDQNRIAEHLYNALKEFYRTNPDFKNRVLFVAGESYAGKYVPSLGHHILMKSKMGAIENEELNPFGGGGVNCPFKLGGLAIGNGLTDPEIQVQSHAKVAYSLGLIDGKQRSHVEELAEQVAVFIHKHQWFDAYKARTALMDWIQKTSGIATPLDVRRSVPYHFSPHGKDFLAPFLNQKSVKAALNAEESAEWVPCNPRVRRAMANDTTKSVKWMVEKVLEEVPVLLYQGQYDIKDGVVSNEEWMRTLRWRGIYKFFDAERSLWFVDDKLAGYWRSYENLSQVVVLNCKCRSESYKAKAKMVSGTLFHSRRHSWPAEDYVQKPTLQLLDRDHGAPPQQAWRRRLNEHANILKEFSVTFMEALKMVRLGFRLWTYVQEERSHGRKAPIDPFTRERCKPSASQGVPLGGMGSGSICRGFRGEFRHWQMIPGMCEAPPVLVNQFSIFVSRDGGRKQYSSVLAPGRPEELGKGDDIGISTWDWGLDGQHSTYHALFPRAWTIYDGEPDPELKISCRQISPFIPHNYQDSSLPACAFAYTLVNTGKEAANVSLLFTWANSIGGASHLSGGHVNQPFINNDGVRGMLLHHKTAKGYPPVTFAIASRETRNVHVTVLPCFGLSGKSYTSAKDMWVTMKQQGHFDDENWNAGCSFPSLHGEAACAAVSASAVVEPHGMCSIVFALAWASPKVKFVKGSTYFRRYTQFYGTSEDSAINLVHDALMDYRRWETEIEDWQGPILKNERLPEWYRFTLFNELYYLVAGGTIWTDGGPPMEHDKHNTLGSQKKSRKKENKAEVTVAVCAQNGELSHVAEVQRLDGSNVADIELNSPQDQEHENGETVTEANSGLAEENVGRFLYLEGVEYMMWCTYDVHFYASFALLDLFPKIELNIQREFAKAVLIEDNTKTKFLAEGNWGIRKVKGAVPHDLGLHDPWLEINAYNIHDTSQWKDLNSKFVLQVYRDLVATDDMSFGKDVWPAVCAAMEYMQKFDRDGDDLIENDGFPDQTYDTWTVHGISAYCGGLWIAALQAATAMADKLGHKESAEKYRFQFQKAKVVYEKKLWNGSYYNYDSGTSSNSNSIQADQLAGQWYAWASGLTPLFDNGKIRSALQKIYDFNVMKIGGGRMGAVNGMHPNGKVDETCMQSREIWTGVTYGVAATMLHAGMEHQAFSTAEGIFHAGWSEDGFGYWFQTPEGWTIDGHYRSLIYMRPLAIWAMQWALYPPKAVLEAPKISLMEREYVSPFQTGFAAVAEAFKHVHKPRICDCSSVHSGCSWSCNC